MRLSLEYLLTIFPEVIIFNMQAMPDVELFEMSCLSGLIIFYIEKCHFLYFQFGALKM